MNKIKDKNKKEFPFEFNRLLDIDRILKTTKNKKDLKITLKKDSIKGTCVYATKFIEFGELIAYYKIRVFNEATYDSLTNYIYAFSIYGVSGKQSAHLIGDIDPQSIPPPSNNIPYWGMLVNEPSDNQDINAEVDPNIEENYKNKKIKRVKAGTYLIYKIIASRDINAGEEITVYYGDNYERDYDLNPKILKK